MMAHDSSRFMTICIAVAVSNAVKMSYAPQALLPPPQSLPFVQLPITRLAHNSNTEFQQGRPDLPLTSFHALQYQVVAGVGTPPQRMVFSLDTGSSDTWMFTPESCSEQYFGCLTPFNSSSSTTFREEQPSSNVTLGYGDQSVVTGTYALDHFDLGGLMVKNQRVVLANEVSHSHHITGIMGIGFNATEAQTNFGNPAYPTILDNMSEQGHIESKAFSLYLDKFDSKYGSISFGGYDANKFQHPMYIVPIVDNPRHRYSVALKSIGFTGANGSHITQPLSSHGAFVLDSGSSISIIPSNVMDALVDRFEATQSLAPGIPTYEVDCSYRENLGTVDFRFLREDGPLIAIPFSDFISADSVDKCILGATYPLENMGETYILGDTFLRSAYVIYDLENHVIGIAPAKFDMDGSTSKSLGKEGVFGVEGAVDMSGRSSGSPPDSPQPGDLWRDDVCSDGVATRRFETQKRTAILATINVAVIALLSQFGPGF